MYGRRRGGNMKKNGMLIGGVVALVFLVNTAQATVWYVHPDSTLNSIQNALGSCADNDTVLVGPGTYMENIAWPNTQGIDLISEYGPDTTIIDAGGSGRPIGLSVNIDTTTRIVEFTLQNGSATYGGGFYCASEPTITGNIITNNAAFTGGGGIYCIGSWSPVITNNTITYNTATNSNSGGGGIWCYNSVDAYISGNTISENTAAGYGGGIECSYCSAIIVNNTITSNHATGGTGLGAGIYCSHCSPTITRNTITGNTANYAAGIGLYFSSPTVHRNLITGNTGSLGAGILCHTDCSPTIDSCIIANNAGDGIYCMTASNPVISYSNIHDNSGFGMRNVDPGMLIKAEYNWWGDPSGPGGVGPGTGDEVSSYVDYDPWLTDSVELGVEEHKYSQPVTVVLQINPNPFSKLTNISFGNVQRAEDIELKIYNATGRLVKEFTSLTNSQISWNGTDDVNRRLPSGVYFLEFKTRDYTETKKLLLIK
jgi:parallel beta-helix repeat protein